MVSYDTNARIGDILKCIERVKTCVDQLIEAVKPENDLWDNCDVMRNWHISERTLASWRSKGLISYVRVNGKIWYPREAREEFMRRNLINVENARD